MNETKVAVIGIIVKNKDNVEQLNKTLSEYGDYIVGRMGLPNVRENMNVISIVIDAPVDVVNAISGRLGRIDGVTSKSICSKSEEV